MKESEAERMLSAGLEVLIWRIGMNPQIPMTLAEAHEAPIDLLLQVEVYLDYRDRIRPIEKLLAKHAEAHNQHVKRRGRGRYRR